MLSHLYETGLRQVAAGLMSLCMPSTEKVALLADDLRAIALRASQSERPDLLKAASEAEAATRALLVGTPDAHVPCVRAVHRLGHLLLLGLRTDAEQAEGRQSDKRPPERKVLVVDDSRVAAFALSSAFAANDFQVRSVATMEEALAEINAFQPCLLVSDVHMPSLDVTLLCQTFRGMSRGRPSLVVLVSGTTGQALQSRLEEIKPDAFVPKMAGTSVVVEHVLRLWRECEGQSRP